MGFRGELVGSASFSGPRMLLELDQVHESPGDRHRAELLHPRVLQARGGRPLGPW